jgi:DNA-binding winged helix-turn-helix (wHTH) protein/TolB-like protein
MPSGRDTRVRFGSFEVDANERVLLKSGVKIRLQEQPFEVLLTLLESPGEIVTREQLRQRLWPTGTFVAFDHALNTAVKKIRAALCDDAGFPRYIETIPRRGYRFLAPVDTSASTGALLNMESGVRASGVATARRFRSAMIACALVVPFLMLGAWFAFRPAAPRDVTLAVLPFTSINPSPSNGAASTFFQNLLLSQLRRTHPARLVIRNNLRSLIHVPAAGNAEQTQLDYVLQGGILGGDQHLHISVQLVRLSDQNCVWARDFDRQSDDLETEMEMAQEIVSQMQPPLALVTGGSR